MKTWLLVFQIEIFYYLVKFGLYDLCQFYACADTQFLNTCTAVILIICSQALLEVTTIRDGADLW